MLKVSAVLLLALTLISAVFSTDNEIPGERIKIRRMLTINPKKDEAALQHKADFSRKLSTMVTNYLKYPIKHKRLKAKAFRLMAQNPDKANPYLKKHHKPLITAAVHQGALDVVEAITLNDQKAKNCKDGMGNTPLDEAITSENSAIALYLYSLGASQSKTTKEEYKALINSKKRKLGN